MDMVRILNKKVVGVYAGFVLLFVLAPLLSIVFVSVSDARFISFPWNEGFSLRWYAEIPNQEAFLDGAVNSVKLAALTALVAVVIGTLASLAVVRSKFPGRNLVVLLGSSPLFVPEVLFGLALLLALSKWQVGTPLFQILIGHVVITLPFTLRVATAALTDFNLDQENAARNLGASKLQAFFLVTFPQIRSGVVAAAVMAFIVSFDNIALSLFIAGPAFELLPVALYAYALNSFDGIAAATSVLMIGVSLVAIVVLDRTVGLDKLFGGAAD
ncbi:MAG: ABC transporter permease subunit [Propionibacteriales bacterium]|nr:ABC transporter permease subunit [Propionibacteriales bacterium]